MPKKLGAQAPEEGSIPRKLLLAVLTKARPAVDATGATGIEQARHFIFKGDRVVAYNDQISVSAPLGFDPGLELTVLADDLYKVLSEMQEDDVWVDVDGDELILSTTMLKCGLRAVELESDIDDLLNNVRGLKKAAWQVIPEGFMEGLGLCLISVSTKKEDVAFSAVHVVGDRMLSTDNLRLSRYVYGTELDLDILLPYRATKELIKHKMFEVQQLNSWVHFRDSSGLVFSSRLVDFEFPAGLNKYIDDMEGKEVAIPKGVGDALSDVMVFAPGTELYEREAEVRFQKGKVVCRTQNDNGWIERTVKVPGATAALPTMHVNPIFFMDILQRLSTCIVGDGKALFTDGAFDHCIILPAEDE